MLSEELDIISYIKYKEWHQVAYIGHRKYNSKQEQTLPFYVFCETESTHKLPTNVDIYIYRAALWAYLYWYRQTRNKQSSEVEMLHLPKSALPRGTWFIGPARSGPLRSECQWTIPGLQL
jgi:hypothetical protein